MVLLGIPIIITKGVEEADKICCLCGGEEIGRRRKRGRVWEQGGVEGKVKVGEGRMRHGDE